MLPRRVASTSRSFSMKLACAAPRDSASRPKAPVPAKASSTRAPSNTGRSAKRPWARMSKSASRARSPVGRTARTSGARSARPRCLPAMIRMALRHRARAELLAHDLARHFLDRSAREVAELEGPVGDADEPGHAEPQMLHDAADLAVLALMQAHREPGVAALLAIEHGADRPIGHAVEGDARLERGEPRRIDGPVDAHAIAPEPTAHRQLQRARQLAVIGEQQQPFRSEVEPADRDHPRQLRRQAIEHRRAAPLVAMRGDEAGGLVIAPEPRRLRRGEGLAVDADVARLGDRERRAGQHLAVDGDAAFGDPALGIAARAQPGARQPLGDPLSLFRRRPDHPRACSVHIEALPWLNEKSPPPLRGREGWGVTRDEAKSNSPLDSDQFGNSAPASTPHPATLRVADLPLTGGGVL